MSKTLLGKDETNALFKGSNPASVPKKAKATPKQAKPTERPAVEKGLKPGETRATIIIKKDTLDKIKAIAYWEPGKNIKKVINGLLEEGLARYEKAKGKIKPIPEEK